MPDTSPRGVKVDGDDESYDFGTGAGFYVDATEPKWASYQMYSYITAELADLVQATFAGRARLPPGTVRTYGRCRERLPPPLTPRLRAFRASQVTEKKSIIGHSMGGHGALTIKLKNPSS